MWWVIILFLIGNNSKLTPEEAIKQASAQALQGNYQKVIELLYPQLYPTSNLPTRTQEIKAHKLLGTAYWFLGRKIEAAQEFTAILNLNPDFQLDPLVVPPGLMSFFEKVKKDLSSRLEKLKKRQLLEQKKKQLEQEKQKKQLLKQLLKKEPVVKEIITIHKNLFIYNFFPFGIGQFQNGDNSKGWVLATGQLIAGAINLGIFYYLQYKYPAGLVPRSEVSMARTMQYIQVGSGIVFWGLWSISVVDGILHYKPTTKTIEKKLVPNITISPTTNGAMGVLTWQW